MKETCQKPTNTTEPACQKYQKAAAPFYKGKASCLFEVVDHPEYLIIERKDDITKLDGEVRDHIEGKGAHTNRISNLLFRRLAQCCVPTHFVEELSDHETLVLCAEQIPLEVIVRNIATGSLCRRLPFEDGTELEEPLLELDYKSDEFHDPLVNEQHAVLLGAVKGTHELEKIKLLAQWVNAVLSKFFKELGIILVDFKLEFGRLPDGRIIVIDEISPDTCRLWDAKTKRSLDKDVFRKGMGNDATSAAYQEVLERLAAAE